MARSTKTAAKPAAKKAPTTPRPPARKRAAAPDNGADVIADLPPQVVPPAPDEAVAAPQLKVKDIVERVLARTGQKKKDVRPAVEATLAVLGEALARGEALNLPGFGKARVSRTRDTGVGSALTIKLRRGAGGGKPGKRSAPEGLAPEGDNG
ncbi:MAG: HU family DNA-binding protein [Gemmobacter sp.]